MYESHPVPNGHCDSVPWQSDNVTIPRMERFYTNLGEKKKKKDLEDIQGLISVDRSSKATQPLTIPRPIQVVYKGSSPRNRQVW